MDRLAEIAEYNSAFRNALTDEDFLAAGYTPEEISAYRGQVTTPGLTQQDLTEMQSLYGTLEAPDYTMRDTATQRVQDALIRKVGMDPYQAGVYARRVMGDPNAQSVLDSLGLADLTPLGAAFAVEEGSQTAIQGYERGDPLQMGLGALEAGLGLAEAFPLTKTIARGISETAAKMDPNTLYSVFGPPVGTRSPLRAPEMGGAPSVAPLNVTRKDASNIFGEGTERVRYTDPQSGGTIEVVSRPDGSASVLELEVPEEFRGQGIGQRLQERVMQDFPMMGGQVSSKAAATTAYRLGRRPPGQPDATLDEVFAMIDDMSSVNLVSPEMQARFGGAAAPTGIRVYHGSPHDFDRFSMDAIGTGEGAQAYGHGLYFAENEGVARGYRDQLSRGYLRTADGANVAEEYGADVADIFERTGGDPQDLKDTVARLRGLVDQNLAEFGVSSVSELKPMFEGDLASTVIEFSDRADRLERLISGGNVEFFDPGRMYEVNIKANPEDFLDWDKPLSEQPQMVQDVFRPRIEELRRLGASIGKDPDGATLEQIAHPTVQIDEVDWNRGLRQQAADFMREAGIPGIKYLDAASRGAGEGSRNYVVFDENLIDIVRKYGIAGAATILGVSALDVEQAIAANVPQSEWDQLVAGPR